MKLTLFSDDKLIFDVLKREFSDILISKSLESINDSNIIIFDTLDKEKILSYLNKIDDKNNKLIININDFLLEKVNNIIKPFRIGSLVDKISDFYKYFNKNIFILPIGTINKNRRTLTVKGKVIRFTEKELELLVKINNDSKTREELLSIVWCSKSFENNVLETTIYNVRQKLLQNEIEDFIVCENGAYSVSLK